MSDRGGVVLWAHLPYYRHAARALHDAGLLERYVTAPFVTRSLPGPRSLVSSGLVGYFDRTRVFPELADVPTRRLWGAQAVAITAQRVAGARGKGSALRFRSQLWDLAATPHVGHARVLHAVVGVAGRAGARARRDGALLVADVRAIHPHVHHRSVNRSLALRGLSYVSPDRCILDRMLRELDAADVLVCNSELTRQSYLDEGFDPDRVVSVPLGCDPSRFTPATTRPDRFTVLFVGREATLKGLPDLIEAAAALPDDARLVIAGEIDAASRDLLGKLSLEVVELGNVGYDDMPALYRQASVFVLPSLSEAFGMVVLEAMAAGLPVVVSEGVGAAGVVTEGVDGCVVPVASPDAIADRLQRLAGDAASIDRMGGAARRTALEHSWDHYGERLVEAYRQVVLPLSD